MMLTYARLGQIRLDRKGTTSLGKVELNCARLD